MTLQQNEPLARATVAAIQTGDLKTLKHLLEENRDLATSRIVAAPDTWLSVDKMSQTLLHVVTDWPGHFPNAAESAKVLIAAGADVNARFTGPHTETPLHWAASSDDIEVLDVLLDSGADIEASGAVIGSGTPLADAVAFGQWRAARRLVERGAIANLWQAAGLGLMERIEAILSRAPSPSSDEITKAFWCACHGGQQLAAEYLLNRGANINWVGFDKLTGLDAAQRSGATVFVGWLRTHGGQSAAELP